MSLDKTKTNPQLGKEVNNYLRKCGVATPIDNNLKNIDDLQAKKIIKGDVSNIMRQLHLDLLDDSLCDTPKRVAKMFVDELFWGLKDENFPKCTAVENKMKYDEMVLEKNISVMSDCEHHWRPIVGKAHVAYIPNGKVLGLSKLNRIVEYFCRRPQIQERLTEQIYHALQYILKTDDIAVVVDAEHFCVKQRGVEDIESNTITSKLGGKFMNKPEVRQEFMGLIRTN